MILNTKSIESTLLCYWSEEDQCYVARSPLFLRTLGCGESRSEAINNFNESFAVMLEDYSRGQLSGYDGEERASESVQLQTKVKHHTADHIKEQCEKLGLSEGEYLDYLVGFAEVAILPGEPNK